MKQITIYEFLEKNKGAIKDGYVAMNKDGGWNWFNDCPVRVYHTANYDPIGWYGSLGTQRTSLCCFNIAPFDGSWKDSLIKVEHKEEE